MVSFSLRLHLIFVFIYCIVIVIAIIMTSISSIISDISISRIIIATIRGIRVAPIATYDREEYRYESHAHELIGKAAGLIGGRFNGQ